jgi:hypothetical protein
VKSRTWFSAFRVYVWAKATSEGGSPALSIFSCFVFVRVLRRQTGQWTSPDGRAV